jgi:glucose/arabinose dehydrogenase
VREGAWYGWPDYSAALDPVTEPRHEPPREYLAAGQTALAAVIDRAASGLPAPDKSLLVVTTEPHAALGGMTFLPAEGPFAGWAGQLLLSEMGDFKPVTNPVTPEERAGFQIERVDVRSGERSVFARNRGSGDSAQPASTLDLTDAFERPVDVKVGPDGFVYVLDYGPLIVTPKNQKAFPKTGKVFRIEPEPGR